MTMPNMEVMNEVEDGGRRVMAMTMVMKGINNEDADE